MYKRFLLYLHEKGMTRKDLSELSGVSRSVVTRFFQERDIESGSLVKMLSVCDDLSMDWLFRGIGGMFLSDAASSVNIGSTGEDSVVVNGSRDVKVERGSASSVLLEKDRIILEKDRIISERDRTIERLHALLEKRR